MGSVRSVGGGGGGERGGGGGGASEVGGGRGERLVNQPQVGRLGYLNQRESLRNE